MKLRIVSCLILISSCSGNYDDKRNYDEYVPEIFMGSLNK